MDGLDRIIGKITAQGAEEAEKKAQAAAQKREKIAAAAEAEAERLVDEIVREAEKKAQNVVSRAEVGGQNAAATAVLAAKNAKIDEVIARALAELKALPDAEYFEVLKALAVKYASNGSGVVRLSEKDLARLPESFAAELNAALGEGKSLVIGGEGVDIDGGLILEYGKILWNCSFDSLAAEFAEDIRDNARKALFP
ncbi:MAG: hypothetical protein IJL26_13630 [Clostridia bacterium]|nr:hypothetical protein [Clostridia bacterium]